ncbi:hypothetical protein ASD60_10535 [Pseudomonas sp. Root562]|nr:hypothetical protein ASD60_10535 [Pseudomonas sp. Root562]
MTEIRHPKLARKVAKLQAVISPMIHNEHLKPAKKVARHQVDNNREMLIVCPEAGRVPNAVESSPMTWRT